MVGRPRFSPFSSIEGMDAELARLSRRDGALRLALGIGLEALARRAGHHEMGFSSVEAYALERCERSARWVQQARSLARKLAELPAMRQALLSGSLSWSMASVMALEATCDDEAAWLDEARGRTVREMRERMKERRLRREAVQPMTTEPDDGALAADERALEETGSGRLATAAPDLDEECCVLSVTVDREDAWLFECARMIVRRVSGGRTLDDVVEALLAEGFSTLCRWLPSEDISELEEDPASAAQRAWEAQLARWREQAELMCEGRVREREQCRSDDEDPAVVGLERRFDGSIEEIDQELRRIASELATRDVVIGRLAERFWKADGWRRLSYATESQYATERLGMSLSAVKAKRQLARRLEHMPRLAEAVQGRELGYEAARLVAQVATAETVCEWVERARERTVRWLRDEADAAGLIARVTAVRAVDPPSEDLMSELERVESDIVSGAVFMREAGELSRGVGQISAPLGELNARPNREARACGRVTLRLRVRAGTRRFYRWLERLFDRYRRAKVSFFHFLCSAFIETWKSSLGSDVAYASIYARDRYRCTCPVCGRTDVTPHHLQFRSRGGEDVDENVSSLCTWCHLEGVHRGRLTAEPPASSIRWSIGRTQHTIVEGRRRIAAASM